MKLSMGGGSEERQKKIAIGAFVVLALGLVWYEAKDTFFPPTNAPAAATAPAAGENATAGEPAAAPAAAGGRAAKAVGTSSAALDPTLHMEAMLVSESVEYAGNGRNIFSPNSAPPVRIPTPVAPARTVAQVVQPTAPPPPPPHPPIDLKFFGLETANGQRQAFLLHGDNVYMAAAGDVVLRRYRVLSIDARTVQVQDMQDNYTQMLPLLTN